MPATDSAATVVPLIVEDSPSDLALTRHGMDQAGVALTIIAARDGKEAMELLRGAHRLPDLVLLDLNLPRKNGLEVLAELAADPELRRIPVVLSSSAAQADVRRAYDRNANATWSSRWTWTSSPTPWPPYAASGSRSCACRPNPTPPGNAADPTGDGVQFCSGHTALTGSLNAGLTATLTPRPRPVVSRRTGWADRGLNIVHGSFTGHSLTGSQVHSAGQLTAAVSAAVCCSGDARRRLDPT